MVARAFKKCQECEEEYRRLTFMKGKHLCGHCLKKRDNYFPTGFMSQGRKIPIEVALEKIHAVKSYRNSWGGMHCMISLPSCFEGKKVRLVLVEEDVE